MKVMGLDLSLTSTGVVVLNAKETLCSMALKSKYKEAIRLLDITGQMDVVLDEYKPNVVVLEGYAFMANGRITGLAELVGVIRVLLEEKSYKPLIVPPARVKKFACGKGNAKKDQVRLEVYKRWGFEAKTNDEVDAYVLARIGLARLGLDTNLTKAQREVIEGLKE